MTPVNKPRRRAACIAALALSTWAVAAPAANVADDVSPDALTHGDLDGMMFVGTFEPVDGSGGRQDTLSFGSGHFWSANCVPCGFTPAAYWVRKVGNMMHFRGEMVSADSGTFDYAGIVEGHRLVANIAWRKDRWYWSMRRQFRFEGRLADAPVAASAAAMAQRARKAGMTTEPDAVCP